MDWAVLAFDSLTAAFGEPPSSHVTKEALNEEAAPLFVTWTRDDELRGCIGTLEPVPLGDGIWDVARQAAFEDRRLKPIEKNELQGLKCSVTVLTDFEQVADPTQWTVGVHGVTATFTDRRTGKTAYGTFLPQVAEEQGWDQKATLEALARKAGCKLEAVDVQVKRFKGRKQEAEYQLYVEQRGASRIRPR